MGFDPVTGLIIASVIGGAATLGSTFLSAKAAGGAAPPTAPPPLPSPPSPERIAEKQRKMILAKQAARTKTILTPFGEKPEEEVTRRPTLLGG